MHRDTKHYTIWDRATPVAVTSSTDASPIVVTATAHGYVNGQKIMIYGHTTNIAANGMYFAQNVTANTFSLQDINTLLPVAGSGGGAGAGGVTITAPKIPQVDDFRNIVVQVFTSGTATMNIGVIGAADDQTNPTNPPTPVLSGAPPNFGGTISAVNFYSFLQVIDLDTGAAVNGVTGLVAAGADISKSYEININVEKWITFAIRTWTAGTVTVKVILSNNQ